MVEVNRFGGVLNYRVSRICVFDIAVMRGVEARPGAIAAERSRKEEWNADRSALGMEKPFDVGTVF